MTVAKSTWYALCAAVEMARAGEGEMVTAVQVAERYRIPPSVLAKVFQRLVHAGIAVGTRGTHGGYRLAGRAKDVTMLDVIQAFEPGEATAARLVADTSDLPIDHEAWSPLREVFHEVDELVLGTFASISLQTLVRRRVTISAAGS